MSACRSCGAEVTWAITTTGKRMPVNTEPDPTGNVTLGLGSMAPGTHLALVWGPGESIPFDLTRYTSHFATCPAADSHRRPR